MARGTKPTPTRILENRGSWRAKKRKGEPRPAGAMPDCPEWLGQEEKKVWDSVATQLNGLGVITRLDGAALARYCVYAVLWVAEAEKPTRNEMDFERYSNQLLKIEREFGLTPSSRTRLRVSGDNPEGGDYLRII